MTFPQSNVTTIFGSLIFNYEMSTHLNLSLRASFTWLIEGFRNTTSSCMNMWGKTLCVKLHQRLLQGFYASDMLLSSMSCAVKTWLQSCWRLHYMLMFVWFLDSRALSHCKDDIGALSWSSVETLIREPSPFGRLVRCSAHDTFSRDYVTWNNAQWGGGECLCYFCI